MMIIKEGEYKMDNLYNRFTNCINWLVKYDLHHENRFISYMTQNILNEYDIIYPKNNQCVNSENFYDLIVLFSKEYTKDTDGDNLVYPSFINSIYFNNYIIDKFHLRDKLTKKAKYKYYLDGVKDFIYKNCFHVISEKKYNIDIIDFTDENDRDTWIDIVHRVNPLLRWMKDTYNNLIEMDIYDIITINSLTTSDGDDIKTFMKEIKKKYKKFYKNIKYLGFFKRIFIYFCIDFLEIDISSVYHNINDLKFDSIYRVIKNTFEYYYQ